jgi:ABC-2 family transporter
MNTATLTAELPRARAPWRSRLVSAEFLKLRKRRGLLLAASVLTIVPMVIAYAVLISLHAADPAKHGPAGGTENFSGSMDVLSVLSTVAAILVGATLGTGDLGAGVFRELVVTGRSRLALFAARVPVGLALLLTLVGVAFAITATASTVLAGSLDAPSGALLVESAGWLALVMGLSLVVALGVSALLGSRGTSIGILLGWQLVAMPLLLQIKTLGSLRGGLAGAATQRLRPEAIAEGTPLVPMSLAAAAAVLVAWTAVPLALGAWRTCTRDA